jgi:hypothetical protein
VGAEGPKFASPHGAAVTWMLIAEFGNVADPEDEPRTLRVYGQLGDQATVGTHNSRL